MMGHPSEATARMLEFGPVSGEEAVGESDASRTGSRPVPLCVVCGRARARVSLVLKHGHAPAKLCLRCHHGVMQQRKMLRADLRESAKHQSAPHAPVRRHHLAGDARLIVPRDAALTREAKYAELTRCRHRAQVTARRALSGTLFDCAG